MKLDVVAIPKDLLLLKLYNNALYQSPKFDLVPTIRQKVAGKKDGMPFFAALAIKEKLHFTEIDLGAGPRELNVNLSGFEVDFTQYDELHGEGTALRVIKALRETIAASKLSKESNEEENFLSDLMITVNGELLKQLNAQYQLDPSLDTKTPPARAVSSDENDPLVLKLIACQDVLAKYMVDPVINGDKKSKKFLEDLKDILYTHVIPKKYKDERKSEFYTAWLSLLDPNNSPQQKTMLCTDLCKKYTDSHASFAGILFHLPKVMSLEFLKHSSIETVYAYYQYREKYKDLHADVQDYLADLVKMMIASPSYSKENKQQFLNHLLNFFQNLAELRASQWGSSRDELKEALSCWMLYDKEDTSELNNLVAEQYMQIIKDLDIKLSDWLEALQSESDINSIRLDFRSYADRLILKRCFKNLDAKHHDRLVPIIRRIDDKELSTLYKMMLDCKLQANAILSQHTLLIAKEDYNHDHFPGLFINRIVPLLKSKCTPSEFKVFFSRFIEAVNPALYAHEEWAFESMRSDLLDYWIAQNPEKLIEAIKVSIRLGSSTHDTPIMKLVSHIPLSHFNDRLLDGLLESLNDLELISLFSVCRDEIQQKIIVKLFNARAPLHAMEHIRTFNTLYQETIFPTRFKEAFVKHLKSVNKTLFNSAKSEQLFNLKDQSELARDLDNLKEILNNQQLTHDQRRSEIRHLNALYQTLKSQETCSVVMEMFQSIPRSQWPYLFVYFDNQIIHWNFPQDERLLKLLKKAQMETPQEEKNGWLNNLDTWKNILLGTLSSIADMGLDYSETGHVAAWALGHIQEALSKSAHYRPDFPSTVLKEFFLADISKSMGIFSKITEHSRDKYDFHTKFIVDDALIASWLPDERNQRVKLLSKAVSHSLQKRDAVEAFLKAPYVRNDEEQEQLCLQIVLTRKIHIVNFLEKFSWENRKIIIRAMYQHDSSGTEALLVHAMNSVIDDLPQNSKDYFAYIDLILSTLKYTKIDVFQFIDQVNNRQKLVDILGSLDFWKHSTAWMNMSPILKINSRIAPENLYAKITEYFLSESKKYFDLYTFTKIFGAAEKMAIPPYYSYVDYLNNHTEEKAQCVQLLLSNIKLFTSYPHFKAIKLACTIIPDLDDHLLKHLASKIKLSEQLDDKDDYELKQKRACLDSLVQVYGAEVIINKCRTYGLEKQASRLENQYKYYQQILEQVRVLCKWSKAILDPEYRKSDKTTPIEWEKIHKINEKTLEVLLELAARGEYPDYLMIDNLSEILNQICDRAKISLQEFAKALPPISKSLNIKLYPTGALLINGIFARDKEGHHLSTKGMKFADCYLSSNPFAYEFNEIEEEFNKLDKASQALLQEQFAELKIEFTDKKCML